MSSQLDQATRTMLTDLKEIVDRLSLPILLIGARARILSFDSQYSQGRATQDWDLAVKMNHWSRYMELVAQMTWGEAAKFRVTRVLHKFVHLATDLEVDIVPFGEISNDRQEIVWSDGNSMSVLGLQEAFLNARIERIDDIELRVLESPAIVALKILAWHERQETKDLVDIAHILQNYQDDDRVFAELYDAIATEELEYESAASALIGRDIQAIFQAQTLTRIHECLAQIIEQQDQFLPGLIPTHYAEDAWDEAFESLVNRLSALQYGISNQPEKP